MAFFRIMYFFFHNRTLRHTLKIPLQPATANTTPSIYEIIVMRFETEGDSETKRFSVVQLSIFCLFRCLHRKKQRKKKILCTKLNQPHAYQQPKQQQQQ